MTRTFDANSTAAVVEMLLRLNTTLGALVVRVDNLHGVLEQIDVTINDRLIELQEDES